MSSLLNRGVTGGPPTGSPKALVVMTEADHASVPMLHASSSGASDDDARSPYGNTNVICGGRCVWASDGCSSVVVAAIVLIFCGFFTYVFILNSTLRWACYIEYLLAFLVFVAMFEAVLTDPGIIPKQMHRPSVRPPGGQIEYLELRGVKIFMPYCPTCNVIRPPRASHCHTCDNCVERFDHHCGIIGACVGRGNFRYFFSFVAAVVLLSWHTVAWMAYFLATQWDSADDIQRAFAVVSVLVGAIVGLQIGAMLIHYIRLIVRGRTQRENVKKDRIYDPPGANPFDDGCSVNCYDACCS